MNLEKSLVLRNELVIVIVVVEALVLVVVEVLFHNLWPRCRHNCLGPRFLQRGEVGLGEIEKRLCSI